MCDVVASLDARQRPIAASLSVTVVVQRGATCPARERTPLGWPVDEFIPLGVLGLGADGRRIRFAGRLVYLMPDRCRLRPAVCG
jgi:hypothetical protein